jgi:plasmid stabilization system protein ParE
MSYQVRYTKEAKEDLERLFNFLLERNLQTAESAKDAISKGMLFLKDFPFACRNADRDNPFLREMLISFGNSGYVVLFEIENKTTVTILAVRHQKESDYH